MKLTRLLCLSVLGFCISGGAYAGSVGDAFLVDTNVIAACSVSSLPVHFGDYDTTATLSATGQIDVTCTASAPYNIALDGGQRYVPDQRRMTFDLTDYLEYELFADAAHTVTWGDSDFAATNIWPSVADVGDGVVQSHTVYGNLPAGQDVTINSYADVINVTVHY